jgi:hypothetical protein
LKGPKELEKNPAQDIRMAKSIAEKWPVSFSSAAAVEHARMGAPEKIPLWREIIQAVFLNGLFFPKKEKPLPVFERSLFKWTQVHGFRKYGLILKTGKEIKIYALNRGKLCALALSFAKVLLLFFIKNNSARKQWNLQFPRLTSEPFWREYLFNQNTKTSA